MSLGVLFFRDCEDEEVQFDADSFTDTVGNLLGEAHCYIASLNVSLPPARESRRKRVKQSNLSTTATSGTGERGLCREVAVMGKMM